MTEQVRFLNWSFGPDLDYAHHRQTGEVLYFTRAEQALLSALVKSEGRVLSRDRLLDVVSTLDYEATDRSIDFVIHRLRRKLGDKPRDPHYIATRYGKGYAWIAQSYKGRSKASGAFIVVGPGHGLKFLPQFCDRAEIFADSLTQAIDEQTALQNSTVLDWHCPRPQDFDGEPPLFSVTLDFLEAHEQLACAVSLRHYSTGAVIQVNRVTIGEDTNLVSDAMQGVHHLAETLTTAIWYTLQQSTDSPASPDCAPVPIRLHEASETLAGTSRTWVDAENRLRELLSEQPDDPQAQIKLASTLHTRYVLTDSTVPIPHEKRRRDEAEIEKLVQSALPKLKGNGLFILTAAKLMYFVDKSYRQQALRLAEATFDESTAFASAFAILGQLRMWEGDIDTALALYEQGMELSRPSSHFHLYLLVLKAHAHMAMGRSGSPAADALYTIKPSDRERLGVFLAPTMTLNIDTNVDAFLDRLYQANATATIRYLHYIAARHFRKLRHRQNMLRRPLKLLLERFDERFVPHDIRQDAPPELFARTRMAGSR